MPARLLPSPSTSTFRTSKINEEEQYVYEFAHIETGGDRSKLRIRIEAVQENLTAQEEAAKEKKEKQNAKLTPGAPKKEKSKKEKSESEE